ncbi:SAV_915 family protein [Streptomyces sp. NPDC127068]|uniref:SAV_915 family protein n=1 Tax=Streptomyces sp. NPDC127068 TaxID=3347127 RepID=UPI003669D1FA
MADPTGVSSPRGDRPDADGSGGASACADEPEPPDTEPGRSASARGAALYVPVQAGTVGCAARLFRTPLGERTAVGFTSAARLARALGAGQAYVRLAAPALRALTVPLGVALLTVDPVLVAGPVRGATTGAPVLFAATAAGVR